MAWKDIPEKKVLATLKDGKTFKGTASEKMTIYVDGGVPGGEGDVQGISVTVDPSTYVMTTQLKDGKGGNVGDPATVDLPLESMVVSGEYDEENKSIILTLKNGETVEFSVADLVSGLQTEITSENPLSANLVAETANKNFVTSEEKDDIDTIPGLTAEIDDVRQALDSKQDTIDENNPLNADYIDDESSDKKLVTPEEKGAIETIASNDVYKYAMMESDGHTIFTSNSLGERQEIAVNFWNDHREPVGAAIYLNGEGVELLNGQAGNVSGYADDTPKVNCPDLRAGTYYYDANSGVALYVDYGDNYPIDKSGILITGENDDTDGKRVVTFIPNDGSQAIVYEYDFSEDEVVEKPLGSEGGKLHTITSDDINDGEYVDLWELGPGMYNCDPEMSCDVPLKIARDSRGEVENVMTNAYGVWLVTGISSYNTIYYFPAEDQSGQGTNSLVKYTIIEGDVVEKEVIGGNSGGQGTLYINPLDLYDGVLSNGINIYSDPEMTQRVHSSVIDEMLDAGDIRVKLVDSSDPSWLGENKDGVIMGKYWDGDPAVFAYVMLLPFYSSDVSTTNGLTVYYMYEPNDDYKFYSFGPGLIATGTDVEYIAEGKIKEKILSGSAAPTNRTVGTKGQLYQDTSNGKVYICTNKVGSTYTWKEIIKNGDNISTLTNDAGYQNASQVSSAIATAVGQITSFEFEVVQSLPASGDAGVIYLVPNSGTTPNIYDEYIWVNNAFEKIGTTDIDLSGYATTQDLEDGLATKADAIDPTDLPSGSTQNGVITTSDHTDIDPSVVDEGQIVVDSTDGKVYIVSEITTDPQTGDPVIVWKEIQTDKEVIYVDVTVTDVQTMTFIVNGYTANDICVLLDAGVNVIYRLNLTQSLPGLAAGVYDFRPIMHASSGGYGGVMSSMIGPSGNNTILGIASHVDNGTSSFEMRYLQNKIDSNNKLSADLIDSSNSDDKTYQTGTGAPTTSTEGSVGEIYVDKSTGKVYVCTDDTGGTYTWSEVSGTQVQVDWSQSDNTKVDYIKNKPTIPTVNNATIIIANNGSEVGSFTTNASSAKTISLSAPVITMQTTDPGEGVSLPANNFIAVYEA